MSSFVAVADTCALFPQTLRDTLLRAAEADLYRVRWSEEILEELRRNLEERRGLTREQAQHLLTQMRRAFPEATVTGYEQLVGSMTNHPDDRHVLATAVLAGAQVIITDNLKDFPEAALSPYNIESQAPDEFLEYLYDMFPDVMARIVIEQNADRRRPPETLNDTLERLSRSAPGFVAHVRTHLRVAQALEKERGARSDERLEGE
jgi:predicted nucleic acid-binding protein